MGKRRGNRPDEAGSQSWPAVRVQQSRWVVSVAIAVVGLAVVACGSEPPPPTVVLFVLDTVRYDAFGCYGNSLDPTPEIDAVARDGVRFDQAVSSSGWTLPAVGSLLTGTSPTIHGAVGKGVRLTGLRPEVQTAAEILQAAGFRTMGFANAAFVSPMLGIDRGFDFFDHKHNYNYDARPADQVIDAAIGELRKHGGEATFFLIHLFDPHLNYAPPRGYDTKYTAGRNSPAPPLTMEMCLEMQTGDDGGQAPRAEDIGYVRGVYQGEVNFMDGQVGRFVAELKALGLYERALIVVTSDHGEEFWEHGGFEHGHTLYDELIRVPLIVKLPRGVDRERRVVSTQVRFIDVMPTVLDLMGIAQPSTFEGESMMPVVRGESHDDRPALSESTLYGRQKVAWRTKRYKYILEFEAGREGVGELYDLLEDPMETRNLASEQPDMVRQMRSALVEYYTALRVRSQTMSRPRFVDMSPQVIDQLRSLGYIR